MDAYARRDEYWISVDPAQVDLDFLHRFLSQQAYWSRHVSRERVERSVRHSLCFSVFRQATPVGFGRVLTDYTAFAYLADVFIISAERGQGLGTWLLERIIAHPDLQGLRRWLLGTKDAHGLYEKVGFTPMVYPERFMERLDANVYVKER